MKVLVIGNGAREHAIAWKLSKSPHEPEIIIAPGNAGTSSVGTNFDVEPEDVDGLLALAKEEEIDLTIVGPEAPLALGIVDRFEAEDLRVFGPTQAAARIESSKAFAKEVMAARGVPTAAMRAFSDHGSALEYIEVSDPPFVVKADGLAAGKGVIMAPTPDDAISALDTMFIDRSFGRAGDTVLIEEWLEGPEVSAFAFVDGEDVSALAAACDYKRARNGDLGPNTGGMGSYSPPPFWDSDLEDTVRSTIFEPVAARMVEMGCPYRGVLYAGLMITDEGPKVIEFNCRLGDPETQVLMPRLESDLLDIILSATDGDLKSASVEWSDDSWVGVVLASEGYPGGYKSGFEITGLPEDSEDIAVFHAGTSEKDMDDSVSVVTSGGRILTAAAKGSDLADARKRAYELAGAIKFSNVYYRTDIAKNV